MNILVADDEERIRENFVKRLIQLPVTFNHYFQAKDGLEALKIIETEVVDIALIDINMPILNGLELIQKIHEQNKQTQLIIISGYDNFSYAQEAIRYGVKAYLLKPVNRQEFEETILSLYKSVEQEPKQNLSEKINFLIKEQLSNSKFNLGDLASEMSLSNGHLSKIIMSETGYSFVELLTKLRIDYAKQLLTELPIGTKIYEIAELSGYSNQYYFSSVFKKETGFTPKEFARKSH